MVAYSLISFDTDHIKGYVFSTSKLKEIRGASSLLDHLNRREMVDEAKKVGAIPVFANGGSGMFIVEAGKAESLGEAVQEMYHRKTKGGASITYAIQPIPVGVGEDVEAIWNAPLKDTLALLRWRLREAKDCAPEPIAMPSHAFIRPCDACGTAYAEEKDRWNDDDPDEHEARYCASCLKKREEDHYVKTHIGTMIKDVLEKRKIDERDMWGRLLKVLHDVGYTIPPNAQRPKDFNSFPPASGLSSSSPDYLGLIYADANSMGKILDSLGTLNHVKTIADSVDAAIFMAMSRAIKQHLPIKQHPQTKNKPLFPFDVLLIGGDDIVMVTDASKALQVASTIAEEFRELTKDIHLPGLSLEIQPTLSVGVVLAPIKYPFGLQLELVTDTLKAAKKAGSQLTASASVGDKTRINFMVVTGSTSQSYKDVYDDLRKKPNSAKGDKEAFYATLRPYDLEQLGMLVSAILETKSYEGNKLTLGRTKLHQLREAILRKNRTTAVVEAKAILRNWSDKERVFIEKRLKQFDDYYRKRRSNAQNSVPADNTLVFPWFADGQNTYRTPLLDFVELYDFVETPTK